MIQVMAFWVVIPYGNMVEHQHFGGRWTWKPHGHPKCWYLTMLIHSEGLNKCISSVSNTPSLAVLHVNKLPILYSKGPWRDELSQSSELSAEDFIVESQMKSYIWAVEEAKLHYSVGQ